MNATRLGILLSLSLCLVAVGPAQAQPARIIMIRHAEKPTDDSDNGLSWQGKARAAALVPYFHEKLKHWKMEKPAFIFAQSAPDPGKNSLRPMLTVEPYANSIGLSVLTPVKRDDYAKLVTQLFAKDPKLKDRFNAYQGKTILICWEHNVLPEFARALIGDRKVTGTLPLDPKDNKKWIWPGGYGRTWVISYTDAKSCEFQEHLQQLMYDDAKDDPKAK